MMLYCTATKFNFIGEINMQNNFVNLANEAINVNTKLFNKSVEFGVESAQQLVQNASEQTGEWLKVKEF